MCRSGVSRAFDARLEKVPGEPRKTAQNFTNDIVTSFRLNTTQPVRTYPTDVRPARKLPICDLILVPNDSNMFFSSALLASSHARLATSVSQTRPNLTNTAAPGSRAAGYYGENETADGQRQGRRSPVVPSVSYFADDAASGVRSGSSVYLNDSFYAREMKKVARSENAPAPALMASATRRLPRVGDLKRLVSVEGAVAAVGGVLQRDAVLKYGGAWRGVGTAREEGGGG